MAPKDFHEKKTTPRIECDDLNRLDMGYGDA